MTAELRRALCLAAALLACGAALASDDDAVPPGMARIKGPSSWSMKPTRVGIDAIDGRPFKGNKLLLDPGHHVFSVGCDMPGIAIPLPDGSAIRQDATGAAEFALDLKAGHEYEFDADAPMYHNEGCKNYVYDVTGGRDADGENLDVTPPAGKYGEWKEFARLDHAGHFVKDWLPKEQYKQQLKHIGRLMPEVAHQRPGWQQMFETESWVSLTYPGNAAAYFQMRLDTVKQACPGVQVTRLNQGDDDVLYELELGPDCANVDVRSEIGRYVTGTFDVLHAVVYSRVPLDDADKPAWLDSLKHATVTDDD